jgi:hypothetical protein
MIMCLRSSLEIVNPFDRLPKPCRRRLGGPTILNQVSSSLGIMLGLALRSKNTPTAAKIAPNSVVHRKLETVGR